jgi:hypothetical protein
VLAPYRLHGIRLEIAGNGREALADCPFCDKDRKFNVSLETGQWRCWVCDEGTHDAADGQRVGGNLLGFLRALWRRSFDDTSEIDLRELASERRLLSPDTLIRWGVCRSLITGEWLVPGYTVDGKLAQLYRWVKVPDGRGGWKSELHSTATLGQQLMGVQLFNRSCQTVCVAEGPWDGMAWWETLRGAKQGERSLVETGSEANSLLASTSVIAVPGCGSVGAPFARWAADHKLFAGRQVVLGFDSDHPRQQGAKIISPAGFDATRRAVKILAAATEKPSLVSYVRWGPSGWDPERENGFDVRDLLAEGETLGERIKVLSSGLLPKVTPIPPEWLSPIKPASKPGSVKVGPVECRSWPELQNAWRKAMANWETSGLNKGLWVMLATCLSTRCPDDAPLWMKLVGPPGCISGDTHIGYVVKDKNGKLKNHKGGPLSRLHDRINVIMQRHSAPNWHPGCEYFVQSVTDDGRIIRNKIQGVKFSGWQKVFRVVTELGSTVECTIDHEILTENGYVPFYQLKAGDEVIVNPGVVVPRGGRSKTYRKEVTVKHHPTAPVKMVDKYKYHRLLEYKIAYEAHQNKMGYDEYVQLLNTGDEETVNQLWTIPKGMDVHHKDEDCTNNHPDNLILVQHGKEHNSFHAESCTRNVAIYACRDKIVSIEPLPQSKRTYDIICSDPYRNFVAGGIVVHNCGKSTLCEALTLATSWVYSKSAIRGFHSGWKSDKEGSQDHGLIPLIRNKTFVVKDADTLIESPTVRQTLAEARDIFDGASRVHYRHGVDRNAENILMTFILSGTERIQYADLPELGERFLTCTVVERIDEEQEEQVARRVAHRRARLMTGNGDGDGEGKTKSPEITYASQLTAGFVNFLRENDLDILHRVSVADGDLDRCLEFGTFVAYMRARPSKKQDEVATRELSARLTSQLTALTICLAGIAGQREDDQGGKIKVDEKVMEVVRGIALDSARGKSLDIVRRLARYGRTGLQLGTVANLCNMTDDQARKHLRFMNAVGAVEHFEEKTKSGLSRIVKWRMTERMDELYRGIVEKT